jgi:pimeloyl-ACP methyl ester carboxylesterase
MLLHGTPLDPHVWDGVRAHLPPRTVAPDLTGLIERAMPDASRCLQSQIAADVLAPLGDHELVVVGHSFGGQVAIEMALAAPERVARLVIVCSRHTPFPAFADGARAIRDGRRVDVEAGLRRWFTTQELENAGPAVSYARSRQQTAPRGPWAASLGAIATYDRSADVGRIDAPASLLAAGLDEVATAAVMTDLAAALPRADLEIVADWAHMSPFADPAGFAARLTSLKKTCS